MSELPKNAIRRAIQGHWPQIQAIYLFGSAAAGTMTADSDVDLAVLAHTAPAPEAVLALKGELGSILGRDVDIVDLARADLVTKAQVISGGDVLLGATDPGVALFETTALALYARLNEERREIIADIVQRGSVRGG